MFHIPPPKYTHTHAAHSSLKFSPNLLLLFVPRLSAVYIKHTVRHTHTHTYTHPVGLLCTSDQPVAETATYTKNTTDDNLCFSGI